MFFRKKKKFVVPYDLMASECYQPFKLKSGQIYSCGQCYNCRQNMLKNREKKVR